MPAPEVITCGKCGAEMGTFAIPSPAEIRESLKGDWSTEAITIRSVAASLPAGAIKGVAAFLSFRCPVCAVAENMAAF